jgi:hypothetical protein
VTIALLKSGAYLPWDQEMPEDSCSLQRVMLSEDFDVVAAGKKVK